MGITERQAAEANLTKLVAHLATELASRRGLMARDAVPIAVEIVERSIDAVRAEDLLNKLFPSVTWDEPEGGDQ